MKDIIYNNPPAKCNVCNGDFDGVMYDASVRGRWGNFCQACFDKLGCRLGTGRGQKYELQPNNSWVKTDG